MRRRTWLLAVAIMLVTSADVRGGGAGQDPCPGGPRQRSAGLRDRAEAPRDGGAARPRRTGRGHAEGRRAGWHRLPRRHPGRRATACAPGAERSAPVTVMPDRSAPPSTKGYDQKLPDGGYGYLRTRDGTSLAIDVHLPGPASGGPYPTLVEYAGYGYADPNGRRERHQRRGQPPGLRGRRRQHARHRLLGRVVQLLRARCRASTATTSSRPSPASRGCSGTAWACWASPTAASASCSSAATDPPHLAAIAPLSVVDSTATTLYPGGILNTGFALGWAERSRPRRAAGLQDRRPAVGVEAHPAGRSDVQGQPGAARRGGQPGGDGPAPTTTSCPRWPTPWRRSPS